ncbi:MAG TPA: hypothetical protein VH394_14225 [Thermoanaerobaculia bacterium]|jgi:hypothetical protein|nr:hypothetical protein [Thermoanaerobaculia bacterium]
MELARAFPDQGSDDYAPIFFQAYDQALALIEKAYSVAEKVRDDQLSHLEALLELSGAFPAFSRHACEDALARGMHDSR